MAKILLETEAASIGGGGSGAIDKKCCTKSRAVALGCKVSDNYIDNQLIPQGSAWKAVTVYKCTATGSISGNFGTITKPKSEYHVTIEMGSIPDRDLATKATFSDGTRLDIIFSLSNWITTSGSPFSFIHGEIGLWLQEEGTFKLTKLESTTKGIELDVTIK